LRRRNTLHLEAELIGGEVEPLEDHRIPRVRTQEKERRDEDGKKSGDRLSYRDAWTCGGIEGRGSQERKERGRGAVTFLTTPILISNKEAKGEFTSAEVGGGTNERGLKA